MDRPFFLHALRIIAVILICLWGAREAAAQSVNGSKSESPDNAAPVSEPRIIPVQMPLLPRDKCKGERHESVTVAVTIDEKGMPGQIYLLSATGTIADQFAVQAVRSDRFMPARQGGMPAMVRREIVVEMDTCTGKIKQENGEKTEKTWLNALPVQRIQPLPPGATTETAVPNLYRVGGRVSAPVPLFTPEAHYSDEARKAKLQGECLISIVIDVDGLPKNPRVIKSLGNGLDEEALQAVAHYRFRPAMMDGTRPVPVSVTIAVNFRLR